MYPSRQFCSAARSSARITTLLFHQQNTHVRSKVPYLPCVSITEKRWFSSSSNDDKTNKDDNFKSDAKGDDNTHMTRLGGKHSFSKQDFPDAGPHGNGLMLVDRSGTEQFLSAIQGLLSLVDSDSRERFVERANKGIINPTALGIPLSLALHHELDCVLWNKYKFDIMEFGTGIAGALEFFHNTDAKFHKEMHDKVNNMDLSHLKPESSPEEKEGSKDQNSTMAFLKPLWHPLKFMETAYQLTKDLKEMATSQPDSAAAAFQQLTTPFFFERHCFISAEGHILVKLEESIRSLPASMKNLPDFWNHDVIIENVTLLSARAKAIEPDPATPEEYEKMNDAEKQRNDDLINNIYHEYPCVAQIEVLYNYKYDTGKTTEENSEKQPPSTEMDKAESSTDEGNNGNADPYTLRLHEQVLNQQRSLRVVFTGWLFGSPDGKGLEWRVGHLAPS